MKASKFFRVIQEKCLISRCSREECFILWINTKKRSGNRKMKPYRSFWQQVQTRVESYPLILLISRGIIDNRLEDNIPTIQFLVQKIYNTLLLSTMFSWIANLFPEKSIKKAVREEAQAVKDTRVWFCFWTSFLIV